MHVYGVSRRNKDCIRVRLSQACLLSLQRCLLCILQCSLLSLALPPLPVLRQQAVRVLPLKPLVLIVG